jgi:hypothetical protein
MKTIPLTKGLEAIVDDDMFDILSSFGKWQARQGRHTFYAHKTIYTIDGPKSIEMHKLILPSEPGKECDHINQNGLDCRRENLRNVRENLRNVTKGLNRRNSRFTKGHNLFYGVWKYRNVIDPVCILIENEQFIW